MTKRSKIILALSIASLMLALGIGTFCVLLSRHLDQNSDQSVASFVASRAGSGTSWTLVFASSGTTANALKQSGYTQIFNAAYFGGDASSGFVPAGFLRLYGQDFGRVDTQDPNLAYFVSSTDHIWKITPITAGVPASAEGSGFVFQSGPLLIDKNRNVLSGGSWHAYEGHPRTVLVLYNDGTQEMVSTSESITLDSLTEELLNRAAHNYEVITSAINLDGGPSVSYITDTASYRSDARLPYFFVRK